MKVGDLVLWKTEINRKAGVKKYQDFGIVLQQIDKYRFWIRWMNHPATKTIVDIENICLKVIA